MCLMILSLTSVLGVPEDGFRVLPDQIDGQGPQDMMKAYLLRQIDDAWARWQRDYDERLTPEAIAAYQQDRTERFIAALGGFPERTPLNPRVAGAIERDGYRIEKVIFESQPGLFVTAALFLPDAGRFAPPRPGVLVPCGHAAAAKAHDEYQSVGALLALNGMVALVFDPIAQGERGQLLGDDGKWIIWGTQEHSMIGTGSILLGENVARFEIWDGMRAIDYLQSRPEVDPERIGCTGNSGGGTQTSYLMALDSRITAAAPSCYLNHQSRQLRTATGDAEQNIFGQLAWGLDHPDFVMMRAPSPVLILAATKDFFDINATWETFRFAKRLFTRMGYAERVAILENDRDHNYDKTQREGAVRWMARWLDSRDEPITEPELELVPEQEMWCAPQGQVLLLDGARSAYDMNEDRERDLAERRSELWATRPTDDLLTRVRGLAGIRPLAELPYPEVTQTEPIEWNGFVVEKSVLKPEQGIWLPALFFKPRLPQKQTVLYLNGSGKAAEARDGGRIQTLLDGGTAVFAVDVRGTGETRQTGQNKFSEAVGLDWEDVTKAYALGRSYTGMRAEDILVCARYLSETAGGPVAVIACGDIGIAALHAAALEPDLFAGVTLSGTIRSWHDVVVTCHTRKQYANVVHGALQVYDLPDLAALLGTKLTIERPVDPLGNPL